LDNFDDPAINDRRRAARQVGPDIECNVVTIGDVDATKSLA
jgi:hypothetical protein